ncbi:MAG: hypothetical protein MUF87_10185 [Anaerolineae bacterium]|jgi:hypothetical protein|nr:hypothetical protein [Anaerolineae bacterium]
MNPKQPAYQLLNQAIELRFTDPPQAVALLEQGRVFAQTARLPCLVLLYDHWRANVLLFYMGRTLETIEVLVGALVTAAKPEYEGCQEQPRLYQLLAYAYVDYDPIGYESEIREALTLLDTPTSAPELFHHWCMIQEIRVEIEWARRDFIRAKAEAESYLARCETAQIGIRLADARLFLARICWELQDVAAVLHHTQIASQHIDQLAPNITIGLRLQALAWQTVAYDTLRNSATARQFEAATQAHFNTMKIGPSYTYYDAMCAYYESNGRYQEALALRDRNLLGQRNATSPYHLTECHLKRIRLLKKMGRPYHEDQQQFEKWAAKLKKPEYAYARLAEAVQDQHLLATGARILRRWFGQGKT